MEDVGNTKDNETLFSEGPTSSKKKKSVKFADDSNDSDPAEEEKETMEPTVPMKGNKLIAARRQKGNQHSSKDDSSIRYQQEEFIDSDIRDHKAILTSINAANNEEIE